MITTGVFNSVFYLGKSLISCMSGNYFHPSSDPSSLARSYNALESSGSNS